jgi:Family of unknown function (DUF5996)
MTTPHVLPNQSSCWPALPLDEWKETYATLHMWTQVVGKLRMRLTPLVNHWWNVPLYVTARGLTTSPIPYDQRSFELSFDFVQHRLVFETSDGVEKHLSLEPMTVAEFYARCMEILQSAGIEVSIWTTPVEIPDPIPFEKDQSHRSYDREQVDKLWRILRSVDAVFHVFRSRFVGKCSPVHFFWGSFDLAVTRFSGRRAPEREGADPVTREAYSHDVSSVGFWPGSGTIAGAAFYSYMAPEPEDFRKVKAKPDAARFDAVLGEFLVMYDDIRAAAEPAEALLAFCQSTYEAGADSGGWDRAALERTGW